MDNNQYIDYQLFILNNLMVDLEDAIDTPHITYEEYTKMLDGMENSENYYIANLN